MTNTTPMTELEAVNKMLAAIGESPINTLTNPGLGDAVTAYSFLTNVTREVQSRGWKFNTDYNWPLVPALVGGIIAIPSNALHVTPSPDARRKYDLTWRQGKLYDRNKQTFVFTETIKVNVRWLFTFEDMPETARNYCAIMAGRQFLDSTVGNADLHGFQASDEMMALATLKESDGDDADYNILYGSYSVFRALDRFSSFSGVIQEQ